MKFIVKLIKTVLETLGITVLKKKTFDQIIEKNKCYDAQSAYVSFGHYHSPYPDLTQIKKNEARIFNRAKEIAEIDLNEKGQLELLERAAALYPSAPFPVEKQDPLRYWYNNEVYHYFDGFMLHAMIRMLKPKRIIEAGSGFTSCVILDTNQLFFSNEIKCTFIEPYPQRLYSLLKEDEKKSRDIREMGLQEVDISLFDELAANDILFIDSTHVSRVDSDVNRLIFEILPRLKKGVYIHFHDIFYPFEIPKEWVYENRAWNETYMLRAFLMYNGSFKIKYFHHMMNLRHEDFFKKNFPAYFNKTGGHIWLQKVKD